MAVRETLLLLVVFGCAAALPHISTEASAAAYSTPVGANSTAATGRQARTGLSLGLAQLVNPANLAQFKSLFDGASSLTSLLSFNMGNLVILSLLAGTALLIAPTLLSLFGLGSFGAIGRSLGLNGVAGNSGDQSSMTINIYKSIDDFFRNYNIDASTCMQRFACSAARKSSVAIRQGSPSYVDSMLNYVLNSSYVQKTLGQTKFAEAVKFGENDGSCEIEYGKCPFSWEKVAQYLPMAANNQNNAIPNPQPTKYKSR